MWLTQGIGKTKEQISHEMSHAIGHKGIVKDQLSCHQIITSCLHSRGHCQQVNVLCLR